MGQKIIIPETCGLVKTGPEQHYFQVRAKQLWTEPLLCFQYVVVVWPRLVQNGITSKSEQNSFEQNRFCVSSMWFGQDWPRTVLLPSQSKTALNRTAFVLPVWCLAKTGPERSYFTVRAIKTALNRTVFVFPVAFKVIPETCGLVKTGPQRYYFQVRAKQLW
jgi:hypothetical protein